MHGLRVAASWILALALAGLLLWIADGMLFSSTPGANALFPAIAEKSGNELWEPTGRFVVAVAQIVTALLLVIPFTRLVGAFLALAISGGAVATHFLWLREDAASGVAGADMGQLLTLAIAAAVGALALALVHPGEKPPY